MKPEHIFVPLSVVMIGILVLGVVALPLAIHEPAERHVCAEHLVMGGGSCRCPHLVLDVKDGVALCRRPVAAP